MDKTGKNYRLSSIAKGQSGGRDTFYDRLELTGTEISINELPAGVSVPFVHAHKMNEEVYIILEGRGELFIDNEEFEIEKDNVIRIDPSAARCFKADDNTSLKYICIQALANSLVQYTENDGFPVDVKPSWFS